MSRSRRLLCAFRALGACVLMGVAYAAVFGALFSVACGTAMMRGCNPNADPTPGDVLLFVQSGLPFAVIGGFVTGCVGAALGGSRSPRLAWGFAGLVGALAACLPLGGLWRGAAGAFTTWAALIAVSLGVAVGTALERTRRCGRPSTLPLVARVYRLSEAGGVWMPALRLIVLLAAGGLYLLVFRPR